MEQISNEIWSRIRLDVRSKMPFFEQIAAQIRINILSGKLQAQQQLPTVRQLAEILQINFNTVARAYRLLEVEDLISTQQGRGTFVLTPLPPPAPEETRQKHLAELAQRIAGLITSAGFTLEEILAFFSLPPDYTPHPQPVHLSARLSTKPASRKKVSRLARNTQFNSHDRLSHLIRSDRPAKIHRKHHRVIPFASKNDAK